MKRISAALALTAALSLGVAAYAQTAAPAAPTTAPAPTTFSDIPAGHYAQEAVQKITAAGLILGFPDGTYRGNENLTRYQAAIILSRLIDLVAQGKIGTPTAPSTTGQNLDQDTLDAVQNAVQELAADLAQMGVRVADLEDNSATKDDLARVETIAQNAADNSATKADLQTLQDKVDALATAPAADMSNFVTQDEIQNLATQDDIAALQDAVANAATQDDLQALSDRLDALTATPATTGTENATNTALADDLAALQDAVSALQDQVANAATTDDLATIQDAIAALQDQVANLPAADDIAAMNDAIATLQDQAANGVTADDLSALQDAVTALQDQAANAVSTEDLQTLQDAISSLQDTVSGLQDQVAGAVTADDVAAINDAITSLQDQVSTLPTADDVAGLQDTVAQLQDAAANYVTQDDLANLGNIADIQQMAQDAKDLAEATAADLGQSQDAIQQLSDQLDATSTAADTALSQARELSDRFDELNGRVDDLTSQLTDISGNLNEVSSTVDNQADSIASLNDLVVLLNQDVLALQDRATEIEKTASDQQAIIDEIPNTYATQEDLEALREYTTLLRRDVNALSDRTDGIDTRLTTAEASITNLQTRVTTLENTAATISGSLSLSYTHAATWWQSGAGVAPDFDIDRVIDGSSLSTGTNGTDAGNGLNVTPRDYTDIDGQSAVNPRLPNTSGNGFTTAAAAGPVNGAFSVSFGLSFGFANRNATGPFGLTAPITLSGSLNNGGSVSSGTAYLMYFTPTFGGNFTVAAGQPLSINFGQGIKFKFANYAFNNSATARGDGFVVNLNGAGILPFSPTLTAVYGSRNVTVAAAVTEVTGPVGPVAVGTTYNTAGLAFVTIPVPAAPAGTTVTSITGAFNDVGATPFTATVPAGATTVTVAAPTTATQVTVASYSGTVVTTPAAPAVTGQAYFEGVKGTLSIIPGLTGGVYYAREGGDVFSSSLLPERTVYGGNVNGSLFGFLNLDGEYTMTNGNGASAAAWYVKPSVTLGIFTVGGNYRNIAANYDSVGSWGADVNGGISFDRTVPDNRPYAPDQTGFGVNVGIALPAILGLGINGTFDSAHELVGTGSAFKLSGATANIVTETAYGVNVALHFVGFDVTPSFAQYNETDGTLTYSKMSFGVGIRHAGTAADSIIPGLNIGGSYNTANYSGTVYTNTWSKTVMEADAAYTLNVGPLHLSPFVGYTNTAYTGAGAVTATTGSSVDTPAANSVDLRYGGTIKTDPFLFGASISLWASQDTTTYSTNPTGTYAAFAANTFRAGGSLSWASFILPNSTFSVAYGFRQDVNRAGLGVYDSTDGNGTVNDSTAFGGDISGLTFATSYYGLNFAYGIFGVHNYATGGALEWGSKFTIGYTFKF